MIGKFYLTLSLLLLAAASRSQETCSRIAVINNQEVLVDISSSNKGEGLRPYLGRDPVAKDYLNQYQAKHLSPKRSAIIGSIAIGLMLGSEFSSSDSESGLLSKNALLTAGLSLLGINLLVSQTIEFENENLLLKSIYEYNKRNHPKIYFSPHEDRWTQSGRKGGFWPMLGLKASF